MKISFEQAVNLLINHEIVSVPTETVYGLAARFDSEEAIEKIFLAKNRPKNHPLILHIHDKKSLDELAESIPDYAYPLIDHFWPGPLTFVFHKKSLVSDSITADQDSVAIRMPNHPILLELIKKINKPLVAPSANEFCKTSPTNADHVENNFNKRIPVLDGGVCEVGIESTIISCLNSNEIILLRPGIISKNEIEMIAKVPVVDKNQHQIKSPGLHQRHYQPDKKIIYFEKNADINFLKKYQKEKYILLSINKFDFENESYKMPDNPAQYAKKLYQLWQMLSQESIDFILIEMPPDQDEWQGVRNRIEKAGLSIHNFINNEDFL